MQDQKNEEDHKFKGVGLQNMEVEDVNWHSWKCSLMSRPTIWLYTTKGMQEVDGAQRNSKR
jgi:hypothetical protein